MAKTLRKAIETLPHSTQTGMRQCRGPQELSRLELECMKAIWLRHAQTVSDVQESLLPLRPLAYTTVLTVLDRLSRKGAVTRVKQGKAYVYAPSLSFELSRQEALTELLHSYFEGSRERLIEYLETGAVSARQEPRKIDSPRLENSADLQECLL
uniref:MarR family transcriptional regulatory protein n=1 Tax=uncultured marine bacterium PPT_M2 TaxID=1381397 RepID=A0A067XR76_9BACT|nr:MarR family transcriptional regulatory protein [uncultured marine bacterium PPT_M2]